MRKVLSALLALGLVLSITACNTQTNTSSGTTTTTTTKAADTTTTAAQTNGLPEYKGGDVELRFTWWGGDERATRTNKVIELFQKQYPKIKISAEPRPGDSYWDNLNTQLAGKNAPDIMQFGGNYPDYVAKEALLELDKYVGSSLQIDKAEKFDQSVLKTGSMNNHLYGVCLGTNALVLAYNKSMLEKAGAKMPSDTMTWNDLTAYGKEIKAKLPSGVFPFVDNSVNQANYISYFMTQRGEPIWTSDNTSLVTLDGCKAWINMWEDMRKDGLIPDIETTAGYADTAVDNSAFVAGKAAFDLIWSNQLGAYQKAMTDKLALTQLPTGKNNALAIQVSQYLAINKSSKNADAAALFINFFVTNVEACKVLGNDRGISSCPAARTAIAESASDTDKLIYAYYSVAAPRTVPQGPNLPNDQEFIDNLKSIGQKVAFGTLSRDDGAKQVFDLIKRLMKK